MYASLKFFRSVLLALFIVALLSGCGTAEAPQGTSSTETPGARLRLTNSSSEALETVVVIFPEDRIVFENIAAGETSQYQVVPGGVYSYAAYEIMVNGATLQQPVMDWMGATPRTEGDFTYLLSVNTDGSGFPVQVELRQD